MAESEQQEPERETFAEGVARLKAMLDIATLVGAYARDLMEHGLSRPEAFALVFRMHEALLATIFKRPVSEAVYPYPADDAEPPAEGKE